MNKNKQEVIEYIKQAIKQGTTIPVMACNLSEIFARQFNESVAPAKSKRFKKVKSNQWEQPVMKGYLMKCCDCGLVHEMDFRIAYGKTEDKNRVQLRARRASLPLTDKEI